jgi:rod shape-determining protein MreD
MMSAAGAHDLRVGPRVDVTDYLGLPLAVLSAVVQSTIVSQIRVFGVSPDLPLLVVVSWVLLRGLNRGLLVAVAGGLVMDALSGASFGLCTLASMFAVLVAGVGETNVFGTARLLPFATGAGASVLYYGTLWLLLAMGGRQMPWWPVMSRILLPSVLLNTILMPTIYYPLRLIVRSSAADAVEWR